MDSRLPGVAAIERDRRRLIGKMKAGIVVDPRQSRFLNPASGQLTGVTDPAF